MLEKPDLEEEALLACLHDGYALRITTLDFLPLGADTNTVVYRAIAAGGTPYFLKLRRDAFLAASVTVPAFLHDRGMQQVISPIPMRTGALWGSFARYRLILYPFVAGHNAFEVPLSAPQRIEFGQAVRRLHDATVPAPLTAMVPREAFSPRWRARLRSFLTVGELEPRTSDALSTELRAFLRANQQELVALVERAEVLAGMLQAQEADFVLCHGDLHGWNLLLDGSGALYIVDWDTLILAPRERDLMFVGSGLGGRGQSVEEETRLFYQGYGQTPINRGAIAYYRYERIIEDMALYCEQIWLSNDGAEDRQQALRYLQSNFRPDGTLTQAYRADTL